MTKIWISKYALTTGISCHDWDEKITSTKYVSPAGSWHSFKFGSEAHLTEAEAIVTAEKMRIKKIASLKKRLTRIEALRFTSDAAIS